MRKKLLLLFYFGAFLFAGKTFGQNNSVTGVVKSVKGETIPLASIKVKGASVGTIADESGNFKLQVKEGATLIISAVGYSPKEVKSPRGFQSIFLESNSSDLKEVIVVAYGTQKKANITGSISTVSADKIENKPFASVDKALQGAVAGLQASSPDGTPGSGTDIRIRGTGSISAGQNPLWVIDGIIATTGDLTTNTVTANALSGLNPDDIESISVLKDASATAIYGSRAANGVILVTTKSGKSGKTKINFSTEVGQNSIAYKNSHNRPMTTAENQIVLRQGLINAGDAANNAEADSFIIDPVNGLGFDPNWLKTNTNWLDQVTHKGSQEQYNLSLSGGNEKTQFYASGGYFNQQGTTIATYFKRYNGSMSLSTKVNDKIVFKGGLNGSTSTQLSPPGSAAYASPVSGSFFLQPWFSPYNADGSFRYHDQEGEFPDGSQFNPVLLAAWNKSTDRQLELRGYVSGEFQILNDLKFTSRYSGEYLDIDEYQYWNPLYGDGSSTSGLGQANDRKIFDWTWTNQLNYHLNLNRAKDFYVNLLGGTEAYALTNNLSQFTGSNFPSTLALQYLASSAKPTAAYNLPTEKSVTSYFSNAVFNYQDKYVVSGSFRRDGSSVFSQNHKWGNFYSVGGAWNINEENFLKNVSFLSLLKLRSSYGTSGNTNGFGYYSSLATYGYGSAYTGNPGSAPNNVGNPNLTWEKNKSFNVGLDFALWRNRLTATVEYYKRVTSDLLVTIPLSPTSGFSGGQLTNVGSMYNKGLEISIGGRPIVAKNFEWQSNFTFSHNTNRVTALYNHAPISQNTRFNITEGHDIYEFYTRLWAGVDPATGDPQWYTDDTKATKTNKSSLAKLSLTGKSATPKYYGAFSNTFTYKRFSLQTQLFYNFGNYIFSTWETYLSSNGTYLGAMNQLSNQLTAWQKPGDITNVPKIIYGGNKNSNRQSTRYLYSGDYIRLRNVELGYAIPPSILKKANISNVNVYVRGTNLFTFGADKNLPVDPEVGAQSISDFQVFMPKTVSVGIKVGL
ncbi:MAG: TonB-dependent receptor [Bacteroidota bacterium]|nr:TonB-dependent receptor [Bacteroidota bacterium]